jgi:drug/metabolite transporter (DMT)-like permease
MNKSAVLYALVSAALFGASTPAAKLLLGSIDPGVLAGLLYCGAGIGVALMRRASARLGLRAGAAETSLGRRDMPWLVGAIISGGIIGPLLLMIGLLQTEASTASLLLTLEAAATAVLAWFVFGENFDSRIALGMGFLIAGATILSWPAAPTIDNFIGPVAIIGACVAWGLDNNLTKKVSLADPLQIVELKGLVAGPVNLVLALGAGASLPATAAIAAAMVVGFVGYGVSLVLFVLALRHLGTARTGAYFSTAPFLGALTAVVALGEPLSGALLAAGVAMAVGVWLHITERHAHEHTHEPMAHAHPHVHDEHHRHEHDGTEPPGEPHSHFHRHAPLTHAHPHVPDMHHTHRHN